MLDLDHERECPGQDCLTYRATTERKLMLQLIDRISTLHRNGRISAVRREP
jgi:hypothetical protein